MALSDDINRVFREFNRYTGDGRPGAPSGRPLPVGDPGTGVFLPLKGEIRDLLLTIAQTQGDPGALQTILAEVSEVRDGRTWVAPAVDSPSGQPVPRDTRVVQTRVGAGVQQWWRANAPPSDGRETETLVRDASGIWWVLRYDSRMTDASIGLLGGSVQTLAESMTAPMQSVPQDAVNWVWWDYEGHAIGGWDATGLRVVLSDFVMQSHAPRLFAVKGVDATLEGGEVDGGWIMERDGAGHALRLMKADGQDMHMCADFWQRGAEIIGIGMDRLSTTDVQIASMQNQSLGTGGDWTAAVTRSGMLAKVDAAAGLMIGGLRNVDNQEIYTDGPRSKAYNRNLPGMGFVRALPPAATVSAPFLLVATINLYRAELGLPLVPIVTTAHGIPGVSIEDIDPDPATGSGSTLIWDNMSWWYDEAKRLAAASGKGISVPWHDWLHGTSAMSYPAGQYLAALWRYQGDFRALLAGKSIEGAATFVMSQPGGNANTSNAQQPWHCVDEILQFCESGGGVLATPEYAYQIADGNVHPDADATIQFQEVKARAIAETEAGRAWTIRRPKATLSGTTIILDFDSLRPGEYLQLHDASRYGGQGINAWAGFEAIGTTITAMSLRGRQVHLTCAAAPSGVQYAYQKQDCTGFAGNRWTAHRGLLRTSDKWLSKLLTDTWLYRWVPSFRITF